MPSVWAKQETLLHTFNGLQTQKVHPEAICYSSEGAPSFRYLIQLGTQVGSACKKIP